jgi:hypothetical protein
MLALKISVPGQRNVLKGLAVAKVAQGAAQVVSPDSGHRTGSV